MVRKVIGIIADTTYVKDENMLNTGCGGTETWIINIANNLSNLGYHVIVFCNINYHHIYQNIEYYNANFFEERCNHQYFDAILFIRYFDKNKLNIIEREQCCCNIWFVAHDIYLWKIMPEQSVSYKEDILDNDFLHKNVKGLIVMSEWHKEVNEEFWPSEKIYIVGNGINFADFNLRLVENEYRDNSILWSSCHERGFDIFIKKIVPYILLYIPDFKVYYASYDLEDFKDYSNYPYIKCLGSLNKQDLYIQMCRHKVAFLPMTKWETFCITILEQGYANVEIVCPFATGIKTSMKIFKELLIDEKEVNYDNEVFCMKIAYDIVKKIQDYNSKHSKEIRQIIHNYIENTYSWENITNKLINFILK